ncbi:pyruvate oxidase [Bacillus sp. WMMC1349]|uniref:pyruvate oxidase n=1 Tax=Bacillus sp. WMMC1349 TaxID=2736254 RepID=UPI00155645F4|nr:pyruvate oxidase [Bacillus sp. WMMC1349]NPC92858.1 pyruvate oxidase [Bacillus sp. WMMC1349]
MAKVTAGEAAAEVLMDWEVKHLFGLPGDTINHFVENLRKTKEDIDFIQVRHEEVGALAASSYAKLTGNIGVCLSIAGPGAIHLMNGLYDAKADGAPVLALVGQVSTSEVGKDSFQEVHLTRMFEDVAVFNQRVDSPKSLPELLNQAIRTAYAKKGVSVLVIPDDIPFEKIDPQTIQTTSVRTFSQVEPHEVDLNKAIKYIKKSEKPLILAGTGTKKARHELDAFAKNIGAPIIFSLPAKGTLPDEHPHNLGQLGQIGTKPAYEAMEETDLLIMIGTSFPYEEFLPEDAKAIQIDIDASEIGKRYPVSVGLTGDAAVTLSALNEQAPIKAERNFLEKYQEEMQKWWGSLEEKEKEVTSSLRPQQVIPELQKAVEDDAILSVDVGNVTVWMARHFRFKNQIMVISSWMATMGCGLPGAIAGSLTHPNQQVVAVCGDGGFSMVMQDFLTAVRYKMPILVVILNNSKLGMIQYEQQELGNLNYETDLQEMDFAKFAEACGGTGYRVEKQEELRSALDKTSKEKGPVIVDVVIEDQPPLPGIISYGQAANYSKYLLKRFFEDQKIELPPIKTALKRML